MKNTILFLALLCGLMAACKNEDKPDDNNSGTDTVATQPPPVDLIATGQIARAPDDLKHHLFQALQDSNVMKLEKIYLSKSKFEEWQAQGSRMEPDLSDPSSLKETGGLSDTFKTQFNKVLADGKAAGIDWKTATIGAMLMEIEPTTTPPLTVLNIPVISNKKEFLIKARGIDWQGRWYLLDGLVFAGKSHISPEGVIVQ